MIGSFTFENLPCRVVFGSARFGAAKAEVERFREHARAGADDAAAGSAGQAARSRARSRFTSRPVYRRDHAARRSKVTDKALAAMKECEADCVVSLGGGSTTGLGKALALRTGYQPTLRSPPPMPAPR